MTERKALRAHRPIRVSADTARAAVAPLGPAARRSQRLRPQETAGFDNAVGSSVVGATLARLVDSVGDRAFCEALAGVATACLDYDNLIILAYCGAAAPRELYRRCVSPVCYAQIEQTYLTSHYVFDPFYTSHLKRVPRGLYRLEDVSPDKFKTTQYFQEYYQKTTLLDEIALYAYTASGWTITACFGRDHVSGRRFDRRELDEFSKLAEVVCALMERHWARFDPGAADLDAHDMIDGLCARLRQRTSIELTHRQLEVGLLILQGHSSKSIALLLGISWQTVKVFRKQLYARCGVSSQAELFALMMPLIGVDRTREGAPKRR